MKRKNALKLYRHLAGVQKDMHAEIGFRLLQYRFIQQESKDYKFELQKFLETSKKYWHERFLINLQSHPDFSAMVFNYYSFSEKQSSGSSELQVFCPYNQPPPSSIFEGKIKAAFSIRDGHLSHLLQTFITFSVFPTYFCYDLLVFYPNNLTALINILYDGASSSKGIVSDPTEKEKEISVRFSLFSYGLFQTPLFLTFLHDFFKVVSHYSTSSDPSPIIQKWQENCPSYISFFFKKLQEKQTEQSQQTVSFGLFKDLFQKIQSNSSIYQCEMFITDQTKAILTDDLLEKLFNSLLNGSNFQYSEEKMSLPLYIYSSIDRSFFYPEKAQKSLLECLKTGQFNLCIQKTQENDGPSLETSQMATNKFSLQSKLFREILKKAAPLPLIETKEQLEKLAKNASDISFGIIDPNVEPYETVYRALRFFSLHSDPHNFSNLSSLFEEFEKGGELFKKVHHCMENLDTYIIELTFHKKQMETFTMLKNSFNATMKKGREVFENTSFLLMSSFYDSFPTRKKTSFKIQLRSKADIITNEQLQNAINTFQTQFIQSVPQKKTIDFKSIIQDNSAFQTLAYKSIMADFKIQYIMKLKPILDTINQFYLDVVYEKQQELIEQLHISIKVAEVLEVIADDANHLRKAFFEQNLDPLQKAQRINAEMDALVYNYQLKTGRIINDKQSFYQLVIVLLNQYGTFSSYWTMSMFLSPYFKTQMNVLMNALESVVKSALHLVDAESLLTLL